MFRNASVFMAWVYLRPRASLLGVITLLSVLGPVLGVAVLVVTNAVMDGFGTELREKLFGMEAHVRVRPSPWRLRGTPDGGREAFAGDPVLEQPEAIAAAMREQGWRAAPVAEGPVLIQTGDDITARYLKGMQLAADMTLEDLHQGMVVTGKKRPGPGEAVLGDVLARQARLRIGDKLIIHATGRLKQMIQRDPASGEIRVVEPDQQYLPEEVRIVGTFSIGMHEFDQNFILTHLETANDIFLMDWGTAHEVQVWTDDAWNLAPVARLVGERFPDCYARTWQQLNAQLLNALRMEKTMLFFLLFFIVVIAAFSIGATLVTVAIRKTREIGILKAMGMSPLGVMGIFLLEGGVVGAVGSVLGLLAGLLVLHYRQGILNGLRQIGVELFAADLYLFSELPARVRPFDLIVVVTGSFLLCVLAAAFPALYGATRLPTEALRNDG